MSSPAHREAALELPQSRGRRGAGPAPRGAIGSAVVLVLVLAAGCSDREVARVATDCVRSSRDPHVIHTASLLIDAEVTREGDVVVVRARVPLGIGIDLKIRFRHWTYRCRERDGSMEFLGYERD